MHALKQQLQSMTNCHFQFIIPEQKAKSNQFNFRRTGDPRVWPVHGTVSHSLEPESNDGTYVPKQKQNKRTDDIAGFYTAFETIKKTIKLEGMVRFLTLLGRHDGTGTFPTQVGSGVFMFLFGFRQGKGKFAPFRLSMLLHTTHAASSSAHQLERPSEATCLRASVHTDSAAPCR
jgi:hypothetical protein